jgi:hypothetical protein
MPGKPKPSATAIDRRVLFERIALLRKDLPRLREHLNVRANVSVPQLRRQLAAMQAPLRAATCTDRTVAATKKAFDALLTRTGARELQPAMHVAMAPYAVDFVDGLFKEFWTDLQKADFAELKAFVKDAFGRVPSKASLEAVFRQKYEHGSREAAKELVARVIGVKHRTIDEWCTAAEQRPQHPYKPRHRI